MIDDDLDSAKKKRNDALSEAVKRAEQAVLMAGAKKNNQQSGFKITPRDQRKPAADKHSSAKQKPKPEPKPAEVEIEAQAAPGEPKPTKSAASMDFGMVDLGGGSGDSPETAEAAPGEPAHGERKEPEIDLAAPKVEPAAGQAAPESVQAAPPKPAGAPGAAGRSALPKGAPQKPARPAKSRYKPVTVVRPRRSYKRELKIAAIFLAIVALVGGAVFGIVKWRASVAAAHRAEQVRLNSRSLDSIKDQALKDEGVR